jgi:two-component system, NtrC family, sensor kinase
VRVPLRAGPVRLVLALHAAALGAAGAALVIAGGLPLAAAGELRPARLVALALVVAAAVTVLGAVLLVRTVGRPLERLLAAAGALGRGAAEDLPLLAPPGEAPSRGLGHAALAFERVASALLAERRRLAEKVAELERASDALARAERLATAGRLASGVAHEVGNPLGAIGGYVELARDRLRAGGAGLAEADDFLARIAAETQRIDRIVRDLLDLARPAEQVLGPVEAAGPLDAALRLARMQGRFRGVDVELAVPGGLPPVLADAGRLAQVFLNLLLNAGDAMGGAGKVRVAARAEAGRVTVEVRDSGPGIAAADLGRVFEPFFTTKGAGQGTGLGLAISQGIVESFGGELSAANAPEGGAVFTLSLRAAASPGLLPGAC